MGDAAQARLDAAKHDRHAGEGLAAALRIDDDGPVGPLPALAVGCVGVVVAQPLVGGVAVDHGVHVAARDAEVEGGLAERTEGLRGGPIGLREDAHAEALRLEEAGNECHAEAGVVDVGVARHQHHIAGLPAERPHLGRVGGEELHRRQLAIGRAGKERGGGDGAAVRSSGFGGGECERHRTAP